MSGRRLIRDSRLATPGGGEPRVESAASTCGPRQTTRELSPAETNRWSNGDPGLPKETSDAALELMMAIQQYKAASGRKYPTWTEILEVLLGLGYTKDHSNASRASSAG